MANDEGFFKTLFDLSFDSFITKKLIKFIYVLSIILAFLIGLIVLIAGLGAMTFSPFQGFLIILFSPIITFLSLLYSRLLLELIMVIFKIEENTANLLKSGFKSPEKE